LGLQADDWKNLASFFVTPAIGLAAAYLLGADLLKVPFVSTEVPYKVPERILGGFALVLCLVAAFTTSCWLTLRTYSGPRPNVELFLQTFFRPLSEKENKWLEHVSAEPVVDATLVLEAFDVRTDLRILVNNSRVFASYRECAWRFECESSDETVARHVLLLEIGERQFDENLYPADKLNRLPLPIPLLPKLRTGLNYIDIFSNNSGLTGCHVKGHLAFRLMSGAEETVDFEITDGVPSQYNYYRMISQSNYYRVCDQIRLPANIRLRSS
jgi:hypothetical protein